MSSLQDDKIEGLIREILKKKSYGLKMTDSLKNDESLFMHGIIDSFGLFEFIQAIQSTFSLRIEDREIHPRNFETIEKIKKFIARKVTGAGENNV